MANSVNEKQVKGIPTGLKIILVISNIFSGLLSFALLILGVVLQLFPGYVTNFHSVLAGILALLVFITSIGCWMQKPKFNILFLMSISVYHLMYVYQRYLSWINGNGAWGPFINAIINFAWLTLIWLYFLRKVLLKTSSGNRDFIA